MRMQLRRSTKFQIEVNLFKFAALLLLFNQCEFFIFGRPQQFGALAGRFKSLIYNRDGKFIYRTPRSNQGHIIVIDDRSPRAETATGANRSEQSPVGPQPLNLDGAALFGNGAQQFQLINPQQLVPATSAAATSPPTATVPIQLISLNGAQPANAAHLLAATNVRLGRIANGNAAASASPVATHSSPPAVQTLPGGTVQVIPLIQLYPANHQHSAPAHASPQGQAAIAYGLIHSGVSQGASLHPSFQLPQSPQSSPASQSASNYFDLGGDSVGGDLTAQQHHQLSRAHNANQLRAETAASLLTENRQGARQRVEFDSDSTSSGAHLFGQGASLASIDERMFGGEQSMDEPQHYGRYGAPPASQTRLPVVHDLDRLEDADGDRYEYYNERGRTASPSSSGYRNLNDFLNRREFSPTATGSSSRDAENSDTYSSDGGSIALAPNSIQAHKLALKTSEDSLPSRFASGRGKFVADSESGRSSNSSSASNGGVKFKKQAKRANNKPSIADQPLSFADKKTRSVATRGVAPTSQLAADAGQVAQVSAEDQKANQYWKQFQDQYEIMH